MDDGKSGFATSNGVFFDLDFFSQQNITNRLYKLRKRHRESKTGSRGSDAGRRAHAGRFSPCGKRPAREIPEDSRAGSGRFLHGGKLSLIFRRACRRVALGLA